MVSRVHILIFFLCNLSIGISFSQTNKEEALSKGREAVMLMDKGKIDESIKLLEEAQKLDPDRIDYPYELAYAHYLNGDYTDAIKILEKNINRKDVTDRFFQLLGNIYEVKGKEEKAIQIYDQGLEKFPNSGIIYLEKGNFYWIRNEYDKALPYYEKGIEVDPKFPSNYYRATLIYLSSREKIWGMIYGEIFINLEANSKRTAEISKLLFNTYKKEIKFESDTTMKVSFCNQMTMDINSLTGKNFKLPFCMIYEPTLLLSVIEEKQIDINSLDHIRKKFIENYFNIGHNKTYPNILFDYEDTLLKAGHLEAYNHWILMNGDEEAFTKWKLLNNDKWDNFVKWIIDNRLNVDYQHKFYRQQY